MSRLILSTYIIKLICVEFLIVTIIALSFIYYSGLVLLV